jgi:hypothetical protein
MKLLGGGFARARVAERFQRSSCPPSWREAFVAVGYVVLGDNGIWAAIGKHGPNLWRERLQGKPFASAKALRTFCARRACRRFPRRELSPVQKMWAFTTVASVLSSVEARAKLSVIDGCRIRAGGRGRKYQPCRKNGRNGHADHPATSSQHIIAISFGPASSKTPSSAFPVRMHPQVRPRFRALCKLVDDQELEKS